MLNVQCSIIFEAYLFNYIKGNNIVVGTKWFSTMHDSIKNGFGRPLAQIRSSAPRHWGGRPNI